MLTPYAISSFLCLLKLSFRFDHICFILSPIVWISLFLTNLCSGFEGNCIVISFRHARHYVSWPSVPRTVSVFISLI